jgi:hypothetical protein
MRNVEKRGVNFRGSIYSVKEGSIRTEYPVCCRSRLLKSMLYFDDIQHYQKITLALSETDRLMKEINKIPIE